MYTSVSSHVETRYLLLPILFCCRALSVFRLCYFFFPNNTFQCFFRLLLLPQPRSNLPVSLHNPFPWFYPVLLPAYRTYSLFLPLLSISTMDLAIFSSTRTATPFWPFSPPVWIILTSSLVKSPSSFYLVSASPITSKFALFISLITLASFPGLSMMRTLHVPT